MTRDLQFYENAVLERICAVCVDRRDDGTCGLDADLECAVKAHLPGIIDTVRGVTAEQIGEYVERIRHNVCRICESSEPDGTCETRERVDCALDRYLPLVVEAIEEIERRDDGIAMAAAP